MGQKTAVYARVSTTKQRNDRQLDAVRDHLGNEAFAKAEKYADTGSGASDSRDDFKRLWTDIEAGEISHVVTWEISRISRRLSTAAEFIDLCVTEGVKLETLGDSFPKLRGDGDVFDKLLGQLTAWMMEYEREMIRSRVQSGVERAIERGKWVGRPPYGFSTDSNGYLVVMPEDYLAMRTAIETARKNPRQSVNSIARACGVPQSTLDRLLKNDEKAKMYLDPNEAGDDRVADAVDS